MKNLVTRNSTVTSVANILNTVRLPGNAAHVDRWTVHVELQSENFKETGYSAEDRNITFRGTLNITVKTWSARFRFGIRSCKNNNSPLLFKNSENVWTSWKVTSFSMACLDTAGTQKTGQKSQDQEYVDDSDTGRTSHWPKVSQRAVAGSTVRWWQWHR